MKKTYHGSCHCKAVTFEAAIDLSQGTGKCNCTMCWKQRMWNIRVDPADFRLLTGADMLADYGKSGDWGEGHHRFCRRCGIATHSHGNIRMIGGPYVSVRLPTLDDLPVADLLAAPVHYMDGRHDNWQSVPDEVRHL
jgi:hypothetical protein